MGQGGDRGKGPNETGTRPAGRKRTANPPSEKAGKTGEGQGSAKSGAAGPKKVPARTTRKSGDK